jgi:Cu/Ag efflux pump CusA
MKQTRFQKELQKEIERLKSYALSEELKESIANANKKIAGKRIQELEEQLVKLNGEGAYANL